MILHDPYALHRKWWDADWSPGIGDESWTTWDYVLADAFQVIQDYTDTETGQYMPYDQSGEVFWDVKSKFSGSAAAIERERDKRELKPGESLYPVPVFSKPDEKPTLASWAIDMEAGKADLRPPTVQDARPPTGDEMAALGSVANDTPVD